MQPREPSMEDILASIKRVIAEEKELRSAVPPAPSMPEEQDDVLELDESMEESSPEAPVELGPPLLDEQAAGTTRERLDQLSSLAASAPPPQPQGNPLEEMLREMLRPMLKQWLDENLPRIVDEHVKREITRITGRPL
jgi:cell pole-organizing protein PopZ